MLQNSTASASTSRDFAGATQQVAASCGDSCAARTILIADDDQDIRVLVSRYLRRAGYLVLTAADGVEALEMARRHVPSLFLLDGNMPRLDGFDLCRQLAADSRFIDSPTVFLTALSDAEDVVRGFDAGGVDYVRKPIVAAELLARIRTHLELAQVRKGQRRRADVLESITQEQLARLNEVRAGQNLLLTDPARFPEHKLAVHFRPADVAGGDFYEIARLSEDELALFVADVSGHDLSMPFVTGALKALAASWLNEALTPLDTMIQLNAALNRFLTEGRFVSACYARFSRSEMTIDVVSAGHPLPLHQKLGSQPTYLALTGDVLGMFETARFQGMQLAVEPGDRLFLYTDGLTEGYRDEHGRQGRALQGLARAREALGGRAHLSLNRTIDDTVNELLEENGHTVSDDIVLLGIEF